MTDLMPLFLAYMHEVWEILLEAAPYVLFGFFVAGMLKAFMPKDFVSRHLGRTNGKRSAAPVFKAALFGIPLPLCSCGVIPAAAGLRKQGASKGAATSFLISTPETGVDSIAITYALLDPLMTIMRPLAAFLSAITAGLLVDNLPGMDEEQNTPAPKVTPITPPVQKAHPEPLVIGKPLTYEAVSAPSATLVSADSSNSINSANITCCSGDAPSASQNESCGCSGHTPTIQNDSCGCSGNSHISTHTTHTHMHSHSANSCCSDSGPEPASVQERFAQGMHFAFGELVADIGKWLMIGIFLAAIITLFMPVDFIEQYVGNGLFGMAMMVLIGVPMYVCATASTPIAAALALKGLSPGAALVFLLAGPATNMATITVVAKTLGKKVAAVYVSSIAVVAVLLGLAVNSIYYTLGFSISEWVTTTEVHTHGPVAYISAVVLLVLVALQMGKGFALRIQHGAHHAPTG